MQLGKLRKHSYLASVSRWKTECSLQSSSKMNWGWENARIFILYGKKNLRYLRWSLWKLKAQHKLFKILKRYWKKLINTLSRMNVLKADEWSWGRKKLPWRIFSNNSSRWEDVQVYTDIPWRESGDVCAGAKTRELSSQLPCEGKRFGLSMSLEQVPLLNHPKG